MEKKRKLPARAAARNEHAAKKRTATPPERSLTPVPAATPSTQPPEPVPEEPPLPRSVQPGNPLPTVEIPQPEDLLSRDYQSVQESGVLAESLSRSRQRWIHEDVFEKYWTKPTKRKVVEPNNPPKESMVKIGQITITVEPHVLEATMYAVKDLKLAPTTNSTFRPVIQYGPPSGVMPPPPKPATPSTPSTQTAMLATASPHETSPQLQQQQSRNQPSPPTATPQPTPGPTPIRSPITQPQMAPQEPPRPSSSTPANKTVASPRGLESVLAAPQPSPGTVSSPGVHPLVAPASSGPLQSITSTGRLLHTPNTTAPLSGSGPALPMSKSVPSAAKLVGTTPGADPIIVTLAEKASEDPHLRDLMKRVAIGEAAPPELAHFQRIIDQITLEYKNKGGQQGPSAERLLVDGRTVKYFAAEVRTILDIVLPSNPQQRSGDLRPPPGSDPLVISLVKKALDEGLTRDLVRRVADGKTRFADATDLKSILDRLKDRLEKEAAKTQQAPNGISHPITTTNGTDAPNDVANGTPSRKSSLAAPSQNHGVMASQQALRSKGPPPTARADFSAIVLEFSGGTGDRYLFPKYSMLEYSGPHQVIASFLIVRRGSKLEYGGDPTLDYYQPITIRMYSSTGKYLDNLARVVAPEEEVRRYMDDVMDSMTRAEYVLLAMRLPRMDRDDQADEASQPPRAELSDLSQPPSILWSAQATPPTGRVQKATTKPVSEEEQYQNFIATIG